MKRTPRPLHLESLEDRSLPATFGVPWPDPGHLTLSFVPDGTQYSGGGTGTLFAGDLMFNATDRFSSGSTAGVGMMSAVTASVYDLYTVAVQEAGHIFGVDNSANPSSVMYTTYMGAKPGLSAGDVADIQDL